MNLLDSVWKNTSILPTFPSLEGDITTDVLIIGGGLAGLLTAYMLEEAGVNYLLIEADTICNGVSRNTTAKITSQHGLIYGKLAQTFGTDTARSYWAANETALRRYRRLCKTISCDFETKDAYIYSTASPEKLEQELDALRKLNIPAAFAASLPLPFPVTGAIRFQKQAQFHPLKFAAGIAKNLNIREHTSARAYDGNAILTANGRIRASHIIVATHFPFINKHGGYFLKLYQERSYVLAIDNAPDLKGMYLSETPGGVSLRNYDGLLLLGGGGHRTGKTGKSWTEAETVVQQYYPSSQEKYRWATQDCMTLDGIPYIGRYGKATSNLYVATGFNKWGMTSSMVAAMILCDMVQGKENPYANIFSPTRTILRPQLLRNVMESTSNLLTFSTPRCPHMGCALKWNPQEHSWDCPCHGSRFSENGTLLDNPATGNLANKRRRQ